MSQRGQERLITLVTRCIWLHTLASDSYLQRQCFLLAAWLLPALGTVEGSVDGPCVHLSLVPPVRDPKDGVRHRKKMKSNLEVEERSRSLLRSNQPFPNLTRREGL